MSFSPFYKGVEEKGKEQWIKGKTMAQWINLLNSSEYQFRKLDAITFQGLCEKSGAIALPMQTNS